MPADAFLALEYSVLKSYMEFSSKKSAYRSKTLKDKATKNIDSLDLKRNYDKAQEVITQIYGLIEANNSDAAYRKFCALRTPLEKYSYQEAFAMLETAVLQAYVSNYQRN